MNIKKLRFCLLPLIASVLAACNSGSGGGQADLACAETGPYACQTGDTEPLYTFQWALNYAASYFKDFPDVFGGGLDLLHVGIDEERDAYAFLLQLADGGLHIGKVAGHIQPAFGSDFGALFRHQADILWLNEAGEVDHLLRHRRFQVHAGLQQRADGLHIVVADVATIFTQVQGDDVGTGFLRFQGCPDGIGIAGTARIAQGGDVVDVDAQFDGRAGGLQETHGVRMLRVSDIRMCCMHLAAHRR